MQTETDEPALARFWPEHSGWDQLDVVAWRNRFGRFPAEPAWVWIKQDDRSEELLGRFIFIPARVWGRRLRNIGCTAVRAHCSSPYTRVCSSSLWNICLSVND